MVSIFGTLVSVALFGVFVVIVKCGWGIRKKPNMRIISKAFFDTDHRTTPTYMRGIFGGELLQAADDSELMRQKIRAIDDLKKKVWNFGDNEVSTIMVNAAQEKGFSDEINNWADIRDHCKGDQSKEWIACLWYVSYGVWDRKIDWELDLEKNSWTRKDTGTQMKAIVHSGRDALQDRSQDPRTTRSSA